MKKLLYTFLAVSIFFSSCDKDDDNTSDSGNNNNSALAIGDTHQGGIIFYLDGDGGGLIAAPPGLVGGGGGGIGWGCYGTTIPGAEGTAIGTGNQNTIDIIAAGCNSENDATDICANLSLGGYSDWFLPSKDELNEMYLNIGQGSPLGNVGGFATYYYWSSTEYDDFNVWYQSFTNGYQEEERKDGYNFVKAVRAF